MDSREFSMKMDHLKKLVAEKDYATALKIVDGIDWNRVKSPNLLALASSVYEENDMLEDAKDKLVIALERSSGGKRILYKLTELAVRSGDVEEAMEYYDEYKTVAGNDPACLLLQYMIMKVKHAPYSQLIQCLETYNEYEPDEKWMYELATTYESAGRIQDCVALCDRIALMFGTSAYGVKALKLKQKYTRLTEEQRASLYPNSMIGNVRPAKGDESGITVTTTTREPEVKEESLGDRLAANRFSDEDAVFEEYMRSHDPLAGQNVPEEISYVSSEELAEAGGPVPVERTEEPEEEPVYEAPVKEPARTPVPVAAAVTAAAAVAAAVKEAPAAEAPKEEAPINEGFLTEMAEEVHEAPAPAAVEAPKAAEAPAASEEAAPVITEERPVVVDSSYEEELPSKKDPDAELLMMDAKLADAKLAEADILDEPTTVLPEIPGRADGIRPAGAPQPQARTSFTVTKAEEPKEEEPAKKIAGIHLIIEALEEEEGVAIAKKELSLIYRERGDNRSVAKADAEKLNSLGDLGGVAEKIGDRDMVIVRAGDLNGKAAEQLFELLKDRDSERSIVLVDTPEGLDMLEDTLPELFDVCDILTDEDAREKDYSAKAQPAKREEEKEDVRPAYEEEDDEDYGEEDEEDYGEEEDLPAERRPEPMKTRKNDLLGKSGNVPFRMPRTDDEVMEFEDFAQYCLKYAQEKGCSISGKTLLALYEKIEIMVEDGIALNRIAAEDCVEEAADHAEHPGMKGLFRKKYDKDDMLILREEDFIN